MNYEEALGHCIFRFVSGSNAYGTNRPDSDEDVRGIFIAPLHCCFDLFQSSFIGGGTPGQRLKGALDDLEDGNYAGAAEQIRQSMDPETGDLSISVGTVHKPGVDEEMHELRKFLKLASDCNPNVVEAFGIERLILHQTPIWEKIAAQKRMFLSKKCRWTFSGYATAQAKRIEVHRGYLLAPPSHKPTREEFGLPCETTIAKENQNAILSLPDQWISDSARETVVKEKRYGTSLAEWNSYKKWERERNPARKELERKYGFDSKHAMHLVRLVRMGKELLRDGVLNVYRPDREELKSILHGGWKYEDVVKVTATMDSEMDELYRSSPLPDRPDHKGISNLYMEICEEHYKIKIGGKP